MATVTTDVWVRTGTGIVASLFLGQFALAQPAAGSDPMSKMTRDAALASGPNRYERQAMQVVRNFTTAYDHKDADKAASYVEDNIEFRGDPSDKDFQRGLDALRNFVAPPGGGLTGPPGQPSMKVSLGEMKISQISAIGGPGEVNVITRRIDHLTINGKEMTIPVSSFFRVSAMDGKIEEFFEVPLIKLPGMPGGGPGPAPGGPPGGPGAPR